MRYENINILYIHSPITYSIGRHLVDSGEIKNPIVICGRRTTWNGPYIEVQDDGIWDIERVCAFLEKLFDVLPQKKTIQLDIYLPHTGFLLGKLLKMSPIVRRIFYIEEGDTTYDPKLTKNRENVELSLDALSIALASRDLLDRLKITNDMLQRLNGMEAIWFDGHHPKYSGAYGISSNSFYSLRHVHQVNLLLRDSVVEREKIWVCMLPNVVGLATKYEGDQRVMEKLLYALVILLRTQNALAASFSCMLLCKFHPMDECHLSEEFKQEIFRYAYSYSDFMKEHQLDAALEPALYSFGKYIVVNSSAASRYVTKFLSRDKLVNISLD